MSVLLIGEAERAKIANLIEIAKLNPIDPQEAQHAADANREAFRVFMRTVSIDLPVGFRATFTYETQPFGLAAHLSVSIDKISRVPVPAVVDMIAREFGMRPILEEKDIMIWVEDLETGHKAVNVLQKI
jgi:hypothetical protein